MLRHIVLNPLFWSQSRWVLRECIRVADISSFFYALDDSSVFDPSTLLVVWKDLLPVKRRRQVEYPNNMKDLTPVPPPCLFALRLFTTSRYYEPRIMVNTRIIVLGASDTARGMLQKMFFKPHLQFTNITVVSEDGLAKFENDRDALDLFPDKQATARVNHQCFTTLELMQMGLDKYVHALPARVTSILRTPKQIVTESGQVIPYDYLILTPGVQFYANDISDDFAACNNVYSVTSPYAIDALDRFVAKQDSEQGHVVVYGRELEAYGFLKTCLERGVRPGRIQFVGPSGGACFENNSVAEKVSPFNAIYLIY